MLHNIQDKINGENKNSLWKKPNNGIYLLSSSILATAVIIKGLSERLQKLSTSWEITAPDQEEVSKVGT